MVARLVRTVRLLIVFGSRHRLRYPKSAACTITTSGASPDTAGFATVHPPTFGWPGHRVTTARGGTREGRPDVKAPAARDACDPVQSRGGWPPDRPLAFPVGTALPRKDR
jgi:hypothetical protein